MLKPAQLYEEKLQKANIESWYDLKNKYWHGWCSEYKISLDNNNGQCHQFVSIDKNDNVIGYISSSVDWTNMSANCFGMISFDKGNLQFVKDLHTVINDIFYKYKFNRIEWFCYADNPAMKGYRKFIKRFGGRECGYLRQTTKLMDGNMHESVTFQILKEDIKVK